MQIGFAERVHHALGKRAGTLRLFDADLHDGEFVAAEARHRVALAHAGRQALGHRHQQSIADGMAERVVDVLEVVEVETEDRHLAVAADAHQGVFDPLAQQDAVGQVGQDVVMRHVRDLRLRLAAIGDVLVGRDPATARHRLKDKADDAPIVELDHVLERHPAAHDVVQIVGVFLGVVTGVAAAVHPVLDDRLERRPRLRQLLRQPVDLRIAGIGDDQLPLGIEHDQSDRHVLEGREETLPVLLHFRGKRATAHEAFAIALGRIDERADLVSAPAFLGEPHRRIAFVQAAHRLADPTDRLADRPADPGDGAEHTQRRDDNRPDGQQESRQVRAMDLLCTLVALPAGIGDQHVDAAHGMI